MNRHSSRTQAATQTPWLSTILFSVAAVVLPSVTASAAGAAAVDAPNDSVCSGIPHMDHPHALLSNGEINVLLFLPDAQNGYYRASRFDWSGVIGCAAYRGHKYWGEWFPDYDPLLNDAITGPVEEFRSADGAEGYSAAKPGGLFVKIGVGVLRRDSEEAYKFGHTYPLVDGGHWTVHAKKRSIVFEQRLVSPTGIAYLYTKEVALGSHGSTITLSHKLKNLGKTPISTSVYDHDFFMFDGLPTGPGMQVSFPFVPHPDEPLEPAAAVEGKTIVYKQALGPKQTAAAYLTGYSTSADDYSIRVENLPAHVGIEQTSDASIQKMYLWSIHSTISPEAYISLDVPPGKTKRWTIHYRLLAGDAAN